MIHFEAGCMRLAGAVTLQNVAAVMKEGLVHVAAGAHTLDLSAVSALDSSLIAATLSWIRAARAAGRALAITQMPQGMRVMAELYGVTELLGAPSLSH